MYICKNNTLFWLARGERFHLLRLPKLCWSLKITYTIQPLITHSTQTQWRYTIRRINDEQRGVSLWWQFLGLACRFPVVMSSHCTSLAVWAPIGFICGQLGPFSVSYSELRLCSANHRAGYFSNLACDWLSIVGTHSEQETKTALIFNSVAVTLLKEGVLNW